MLMTEIRREPVSLPNGEDFSLHLAEKAESVLGYSLMKEKIANISDQCALSRTLRMLEIEPLRRADVDAYKLERLKEATQKSMEEWLSETKRADEWGSFSGPSWRGTKIEEYKFPIPEFVLNKAVQIREAIPDCSILIFSLEERPDPFLLVRTTRERETQYGKLHETVEEFYIDVWDEPRFEGKL